MPHPDEILAQKLAEEREERAKADADRAQLTRQAHAHTAARLELLLKNPDVQWFLETFVDAIVKEEDEAVHDLKRAAHDRDISTHRHALAVKIRGLMLAKFEENAAKANDLTGGR